MAETLGLSDEEEKVFATFMEGGNEVLFGADLDLSSVHVLPYLMKIKLIKISSCQIMLRQVLACL